MNTTSLIQITLEVIQILITCMILIVLKQTFKSKKYGLAEVSIERDLIQFVTSVDEVSSSLLQTVLKIGFNRASYLIERLEKANLIKRKENSTKYKVLITDERLALKLFRGTNL